MFPIIRFDSVEPEKMIYTGYKTQLTKYHTTQSTHHNKEFYLISCQNLQMHINGGQNISQIKHYFAGIIKQIHLPF